MQQINQNQAMGYDRASITFSPDGRLLQVEYARKTVRQGASALGMVCKDGVVLIADKKVSERLIVSDSIEKTFQVDEHIGATATGLVMDGRVLIEKAQLIAQQHRIVFDSPIDLLSLVKEISNIKQAFTQYGGARPFGVSLLFAAVNGKPQLFVTDPTGIFFEYKATGIGEGETEIKQMLDKEYKESMTIVDATKLGVSILKRVLNKEFDMDRLDVAYISLKDKKFRRLSREELQKAK